MESFNNSNNSNIELAQQKKPNQFQKIKKILKKALKSINKKIKSKKSVEKETRSDVNDNNFNEMLERRMEAQENLINEQIIGKQEEASSYCFVESEFGKFYWLAGFNRFVACDFDFVEPLLSSTFKAPQVQCY